MGLAMNRTDFQRLARLRVKEAKTLLDNQCYEGAYYLLGYAVECAFKACIAKRIKRYEFPDKKLVNEIYTHDLSKLLSVSGLELEHREEIAANPNFESNWVIVKQWSEQARYLHGVSRSKARELYLAVVSNRGGVLPWLKKWW
jgi:HEPN domain-containing protein